MKKINLLLLILLSTTVLSADNSRSEKWEFFFSPIFVDSNVVEFDGGSKADINSHSSFGFGFGYNFDEHMELSMLFTSSSTNYKGTVVKENGSTHDYTSNMYVSSFNIAGTYNFIDGPLTPYVTGIIGTTYIDSGVTTGDIDLGCYWDPWWGYICAPYADTYNSTNLNYGASIGIRYDFDNMLYLKAGIGKNWINIDRSSSNDFLAYDLTIGITF